MSKKQADPVANAPREVLILCDCVAGKSGQVVALGVEDIARLKAAGEIDDNPEAIKGRG